MILLVIGQYWNGTTRWKTIKNKERFTASNRSKKTDTHVTVKQLGIERQCGHNEQLRDD